MSVCHGLTRQGQACRRRPSRDRQFCAHHDPEPRPTRPPVVERKRTGVDNLLVRWILMDVLAEGVRRDRPGYSIRWDGPESLVNRLCLQPSASSHEARARAYARIARGGRTDAA